jgi:hypothetical protein
VIDGVTDSLSPAWWLNRLATRLWWPVHQNRLRLLDSWYRGEPPMPFVKPEVREAIVALLGLSRSNFAALVVEALRERVIPVGLRAAGDGLDTDDQQGWDLWQQAGLDVTSADVHRWMLTAGRSYAIVNAVDPDTGAPTVTCEPPTCAITEQDPEVPQRTMAGLKFMHNPILGRDLLYLYLPGAIWTAWKPCPVEDQCSLSFSPETWSWNTDADGAPIVQKLPAALSNAVPMVEFVNYGDGAGEFELHLDLLGRINHTILQRVIISVMQAFRQRAIKGLPQIYPPGHPKAGQDIDYSDIFVADPGAFWQLPADADMWESGQVDLNGILSAVKDDITHLAAVTRTPMHVLMPEGANQSAEGASLAREGLVFKADDRLKRLSVPWARVMTLANLWAGREDAMVRPGQLLWQPPERYSLAERGAAAAQAKDVPWRTKMTQIWGFSPTDVDRMESERADDQLLAGRISLNIAAEAGSQVDLPGPLAGAPVPPAPAGAPKPAAVPAPAPAGAGG